MRMAMIGLGRMGANMARRLCRADIEVVGFNRSKDIIKQLTDEEGMLPASSIDDVVSQLPTPRIVWLMLPAGQAVRNVAMPPQSVAALSYNRILPCRCWLWMLNSLLSAKKSV